MSVFLTQSAKHFNLQGEEGSFTRFSSKEMKISFFQTPEQSVIVCSLQNNDDLIELLLLCDLLRNSKIILVLTYLFYARDNKNTFYESNGARVITKLIEQIGVDKVYVLDPHSNLFSIANIEFSAFNLFADDIQQRANDESVIVAPDSGIASKACNLAAKLNISYVQCTKIRHGNNVDITVHGSVFQKKCILVDDIIDSYGTMEATVLALQQQKPSSISCYCTHGVLSPGSVTRIVHSPVSEVVITDSIFRPFEVRQCDKIRVISIKPLLQSIIDGML